MKTNTILLQIRMFKLFRLMTLLLATLCVSTLRAEDWPQWFGPQRDGIYREKGILESFPKDGLTVKWRAPIFGGYAGPAVANGKVFVMDFHLKEEVKRPTNAFKRITQPGVERVICLNEKTGEVIWKHAYDCDYSMSYSSGPRTTPTVEGDRVYCFGGEGDLMCLDIETGKPIWQKKLSGEQSPTPMWGFSSHPMIYNDKVICLVGGAGSEYGKGVVRAFDKTTGRDSWSALTAKEPGYSAPILIEQAGVKQLIIFTTNSISSLDPERGTVYWTQPYGPARVGVSIVTPRFYRDAVLGDLLLVCTQYEGTMVIKLDQDKPTASVLWKRVGKSERKSEALHTLMSSPVMRDQHVYGICVFGELRCLDLRNGDRLWETTDATTYDAGQQKWASAFLIPIGETGNRFYIFNEHGDLILADLSPKKYEEISKAHLIEPTNTDPGRPVVWTVPAFANRAIFVRNDKEIICFDNAAK